MIVEWLYCWMVYWCRCGLVFGLVSWLCGNWVCVMFIWLIVFFLMI